MPKGNVLTPDQRQEIITHRLNGVPVRAVVQLTGHASQTVVNVFREYREQTAAERAEELEQVRAGLVERHEDAAFVSREEAKAARRREDWVTFTRCLREERDSLREVARLTGADLPVKVEVSGQVTVSVQQEREALKARLVAMCQSPN